MLKLFRVFLRAFVLGYRLGWLAFAVDPAYDYFAGLFVVSFAVELEQPQIVAVGSFLFRRGEEVRSELREQLAQRFEVFVRLRCFLVLSSHACVSQVRCDSDVLWCFAKRTESRNRTLQRPLLLRAFGALCCADGPAEAV